MNKIDIQLYQLANIKWRNSFFCKQHFMTDHILFFQNFLSTTNEVRVFPERSNSLNQIS